MRVDGLDEFPAGSNVRDELGMVEEVGAPLVTLGPEIEEVSQGGWYSVEDVEAECAVV